MTCWPTVVFCHLLLYLCRLLMHSSAVSENWRRSNVRKQVSTQHRIELHFSVAKTMSSIVVTDGRRFDDYTSRLRFHPPPPDYYIQHQYNHVDDVVAAAAGTDCRTYSEVASCDSSRSPAYLTCSCGGGGALRDTEPPKTPGTDSAGPSSSFLHNHHHHHYQQPTSFAIHQLLGLGADFRDVDVLQTIDTRRHLSTPLTCCRCADCTSVQSFNHAIDPLLPASNCLGPRGSQRADLPYYNHRPSSASECSRPHHGSPASRWSHIRDPFQLPTALKSWSNGEPPLPKKTVRHHHQQPQQEHRNYDELQAYYCAARLQPPGVDVVPHDSVIKQCRNISCLPPNFGVSAANYTCLTVIQLLSRKKNQSQCIYPS